LNNILKSALREPLVHFIVLGALIFIVYGFLRPMDDNSGGEILVSDGRAASMVQTFIRTWQRPPTESEFNRLIDDYIRTEVFVREAVALGLDRDDLILRRRLRQKMEFFLDKAPDREEPSEEKLLEYLALHVDQYRTDTRVTFSHVYMDPQRRGETLKADAQRLLEALRNPTLNVDSSTLGDPIMILKPNWQNVSRSEVVGLFGSTFVDALLQQSPGEWIGPLTSAYGEHLVKIDSLQVGVVPALNNIRTQVEYDWRTHQREEQREISYHRLLKKYRVERPQIGQP
jgi:hypothetical protein